MRSMSLPLAWTLTAFGTLLWAIAAFAWWTGGVFLISLLAFGAAFLGVVAGFGIGDRLQARDPCIRCGSHGEWIGSFCTRCGWAPTMQGA